MTGPFSSADAEFGVCLTGSVPGTATARMARQEARREWYLPMVDLALGVAAWSTEVSDRTGVALGLRLGVGPPVRGAQCLTSETSLDWIDGECSSSSGEVRAESGELVARASGTFLRIDLPGPTTDRSLVRPAPTTTFEELTGLRPGTEDTLTLPPGTAFANHRGVLHGGVLAAMVAHGMERAARRHDSPHARLASLAVDYLAAVPLTEGPVCFGFGAERAGGRAVFVSASVVSARGVVCSRARGIVNTTRSVL